MILFSNVLITDRRFSTGSVNRANRLDVFKYTLASYAVIPEITEAIVYCELESGHAARQTELWDYITALFPDAKVTLCAHSPSTQHQWRVALEETGLLTTTEPILYLGNDDHVFIDYDLDVLREGLDLMAREPAGQINSLHFTSWTESISTVFGLGEYTRDGRYWVTDQFYVDAIQIVNAAYFQHLFYGLELGDLYVRRTDPILDNWYPYLGGYRYPLVSGHEHPPVKSFLPLRELVRHFDAYTHVEVPTSHCPVLTIPPGFFEGNIRIANADQKLLEDLPLFWHGRIAHIEKDDGQYSRQQLLDVRNLAHKRCMTAPHMRLWQNPRIRNPVKFSPKFRDFGRADLPLDEETLRVGYRTV